MQANAQESMSENWVRLTKDIYIDKNSIKKEKYSVSAWFKEYASADNDLLGIYSFPAYYELSKYEIYCQDNALDIKHIKVFDKNNKLLLDEPDNYDIYSTYQGVINGEVYYNALCK